MKNGHISWDEYFMGVALLSAYRSKDPNTKVGACIVDSRKKIVGVGYNGFPTGCDDALLPWEREGDFLNTKYPYVCHAELNAILNSTNRYLDDCTMYVAQFPCNECAKAIIQSGIKKVVYLDDKYKDTDRVIASKRMFDMAKVEYTKLDIEIESISLKFKGDFERQ
jgi:dCMP deaminase